MGESSLFARIRGEMLDSSWLIRVYVIEGLRCKLAAYSRFVHFFCFLGLTLCGFAQCSILILTNDSLSLTLGIPRLLAHIGLIYEIQRGLLTAVQL